MGEVAARLPMWLGAAVQRAPPNPDQSRALALRMSTHNPVAPAWTCAGCGDEWPCPTRRKELRAEFDGAPVSLSIYMGAYLVAAAADLQYVPAGWLHSRFVGWAR